MNVPFIGKVGLPLIALLIVASATAYMLFVYFVGAEMAKTLVWCASKGERCTIARQLDERQVEQFRSVQLEVAE